jgi:hypothetical protein
MIHIDPVTRQRRLIARHTGDYTYDLSGDDAVAKEDVPLIGPWTDWTGSNLEVNSKSQQFFASTENSLQGNDAGVEGYKLPNLSVIGTRAGTHRRRIIKRHLDLKSGELS